MVTEQTKFGVLANRLGSRDISDDAKEQYRELVMAAAVDDSDPSEEDVAPVLALMNKDVNGFRDDVRTIKDAWNAIGALPAPRPHPGMESYFRPRRGVISEGMGLARAY
jgi:hypothetical protein